MRSAPPDQPDLSLPRRAPLPQNRLEALIRLSTEAPLDLDATSFLFVRHGETDGNRNHIFQTAEQELNARGLAQAAEAANVLANIAITRIVASTMPRAYRTAQIIAERQHFLNRATVFTLQLGK